MSKGVKRDVFGAVGHIGVKEGVLGVLGDRRGRHGRQGGRHGVCGGPGGVLGVLGDQDDQGAKRKFSGCRGVKATVIGSQRVKEDLPEAPRGQR